MSVFHTKVEFTCHRSLLSNIPVMHNLAHLQNTKQKPGISQMGTLKTASLCYIYTAHTILEHFQSIQDGVRIGPIA